MLMADVGSALWKTVAKRGQDIISHNVADTTKQTACSERTWEKLVSSVVLSGRDVMVTSLRGWLISWRHFAARGMLYKALLDVPGFMDQKRLNPARAMLQKTSRREDRKGQLGCQRENRKTTGNWKSRFLIAIARLKGSPMVARWD